MTETLPRGWCLAPLERLVENLDGKRIPVKASDRAERQGKYPYYGASGIIDQVEDFLFDGSYLLIAEDGANLLSRSTPIAFQAHGQFWVNNHAHITKPLFGAPLGYVESFLNSIDLAPFVTGTAQPKLTQKALNRIDVPVAPLNEQRRIVAKLEALQARSRRAREALDAVPPLLEKLRQSILAAAFRGDLTKDWRAKHKDVEPASELLKRIRVERRKKWEEAELAKMKAKGKVPKGDEWKAKYKEPEPVDATGLPELPEGWCWASVEELTFESTYGTSSKSSESPDGVPVLGMSNIRDGELVFGKLKTLPAAHEEFPALLLRDGDLLFNRTNSPELVGKTAVFRGQGPCSFASYLIRLRTALIEPELVAFFINSPFGRDWVASVVSQQVGQANVNGTKLAALAIPVPPLGERSVLLPRVASALDGVRAKKRQHREWTEGIAQVDRAVLAKAFRGELIPQDPNDEPAEVMLARAKVASAANDAHGGKSKARRGRGQRGARAEET